MKSPIIIPIVAQQADRKAAAEKTASVIAELRALKLARAAELIEAHGHRLEDLLPWNWVPQIAAPRRSSLI